MVINFYGDASPFKTLTPNLVNRFPKKYLKAYRPRYVEGSYVNAIHSKTISCLKWDIDSGAMPGSAASVSKRETLKALATMFFSSYWSEQSRNVALAEGQPVDTAKEAEPVVKVETLSSGVRYADVIIGTGPTVQTGDTLVLQIRGRVLKDGKAFMDTASASGPVIYTVGIRPPVITEGLEEALSSMRQGGRRYVTVPASRGYGRSGIEAPLRMIPRNATLVYDVEILRCSAKEAGLACCSDAEYEKCDRAQAPNVLFDDKLGLNPGLVWI